jgi:hypothetical protein
MEVVLYKLEPVPNLHVVPTCMILRRFAFLNRFRPRITYDADGASRDFFFLKFQDHDPEVYGLKFRREKYFNPQTFRGPIVNKNFSRVYCT